MIADDTSPRGYWPLARVAKSLPSGDGRDRSRKTASGSTYRRPVNKLCLLEGARKCKDKHRHHMA